MLDSDEVRELLAMQAEQIRVQTEQMRALSAQVQAQSDLIASRIKPEVGSDVTVNDLWKSYEPTLRKKAGGATVKSMIKPVLDHFGPRRCLSLVPEDWDDYRDNVRANAKTLQGGPPAASTLNQELRYLKRLLNWAVENKRLSVNPITPAKMLKARARETIIPVDKDQDIVRHAHPLAGVAYIVRVDSAMRPGEVRRLDWAWINLDEAWVDLPWWITKSRKARRVKLTDRAVMALRSVPRVIGCSAVFANPATKKPYSVSIFRDWWIAAANGAGLEAAPGEKRVTQHAARHTGITRMIKVAPIPVVMKQAGHESAQMTLRYTHITDDDLDELKREMDKEITERMRRGPRACNHAAEETQATSTKITGRP